MSIVVNIHNEGGFDSIPKEKTKIIVEQLLADYNIKEANFNIIYLNDKEIHEINKQYLQHDYPTDVITFVIDEENTESDIYIGVETAEENAKEYGATIYDFGYIRRVFLWNFCSIRIRYSFDISSSYNNYGNSVLCYTWK